MARVKPRATASGWSGNAAAAARSSADTRRRLAVISKEGSVAHMRRRYAVAVSAPSPGPPGRPEPAEPSRAAKAYVAVLSPGRAPLRPLLATSLLGA